MNKPSSKPKDRPLTRRATFSHWVAEQTRFSDTDMLGHVNNLAYTAYCESGRSHFMREMVIHQDPELRTLFVVARLSVDFLCEVHWPADIDVGTGILSVGRTSAVMGHGLFVGERCVATAESVIVAIDEISRVPRPVPDWVLAHFARFSIDAMG